MKQFLHLTAAFFFLVNAALAGPVDRELAREVAHNHYWQYVQLERAVGYDEISPELCYSASVDGIKTFYVFNINDRDGFVIVAADDAVYPVLGYALKGSFRPEKIEKAHNVKAWLNHYNEQIGFAIRNKLAAHPEIQKTWDDLLESGSIEAITLAVDPLLSTSWDQDCYYNEDCPVDYSGPCDHVYAGCVATTMGQIMKYHAFPQQGSGSHSYYHSSYGTLSANFGATTYDWAGMPNQIYSDDAEIAELLYHCGVSVEMNYGPNGSGAYSADARDALVTYFSYSSDAYYANKYNYNNTTWVSMLKNNLDAGNPVYYRGCNSSSTSCHAFVCDGYQGTDYFHFNWGWSGYYNGYFYLDNLTPGSSNFSYSQGAIFDIYPEEALIAPTNLQASVNGNDVSLSWNAPSGKALLGYNVYRDGLKINTALISQVEYLDEDVPDGTYLYGVTAVYSGGESNPVNLQVSVEDVLHFQFEGGNPADPIWTIYLSGATLEDVNLQPDDEIAIFDGETMVGAYKLEEVLTPENALDHALLAWSTLVSGDGYEPGNPVTLKCWDASEELETALFDVEFLNPYGDAWTEPFFPEADGEYSIASIDFISSYFNFEGGNPADPIWTLYLSGGTLDGIDLQAGDEIAIFDGETMVGAYQLEEVLTPGNALDHPLLAWSTLVSGDGYVPGNPVSFKCYDVSEEMLIEFFDVSFYNPYGDAWTEPFFPAADGEYSIIDVDFETVMVQSLQLETGYQFVSSYIIPENPDMMDVLQEILNSNLNFVRNSQGNMLKKIGPTWVNNIGNWMTKEGYLFRMNAPDNFSVAGAKMDHSEPIDLNAGYQFISYLIDYPVDATVAMNSILNSNLNFVRNTGGSMLKKIGPNWVNNIGDLIPGEGYLVRMNNPDQLIYSTGAKSSVVKPTSSCFHFEGGNAADPVYSLYLSGDLNPGDEVAAFDGDKMVGATVITSQEALYNELPVFSTLNSGTGFLPGNAINLKVYDAETGEIYEAPAEFTNPYGDAYTEQVYPSTDGEYSLVRVTKSGLLPNSASEVKLYPNPVSHILNVTSGTQMEGLRMMNYMGQLVYQTQVDAFNFSFDLSGFDPGAYLIEVITADQQRITKRVMVN